MPAVSVIIPAYNASRYIAETIASVGAQTFGDIELIVVDNGSTDETLGVAQAACACLDCPWQIVHEPRKGVSAARNKGIAMAKGEWLHFLDADDVIACRKIELQIAHAGTSPRTPDIVFSNWQYANTSSNELKPVGTLIEPLRSENTVWQLFDPVAPLATGSQLLRATAVRSIGGFNENLSCFEDLDVSVRLAIAGFRFERCGSDVPLFFYRKGILGVQDTKPKYAPRVAFNGWIHVYRRVTDAQRNGTLAGPDDEDLTHVFSSLEWFIRSGYFYDRSVFNDALKLARELDPQFVYRASKPLNIASRLLGIEGAEWTAARYRAMKRLASRASGQRAAT